MSHLHNTNSNRFGLHVCLVFGIAVLLVNQLLVLVAADDRQLVCYTGVGGLFSSGTSCWKDKVMSQEASVALELEVCRKGVCHPCSAFRLKNFNVKSGDVILLTAAHCLHVRDTAQMPDEIKITGVGQFDSITLDNTDATSSPIKRVYFHSFFQKSDIRVRTVMRGGKRIKEVYGPLTQDWGFIWIDPQHSAHKALVRFPTKDYQTLGMNDPLTEISVAGYPAEPPANQPKGLYVSSSPATAVFTTTDRGTLAYSAMTSHGQSGGPVWSSEYNGRVVGVHSRRETIKDASGANKEVTYGVLITPDRTLLIANMVNAWLLPAGSSNDVKENQ